MRSWKKFIVVNSSMLAGFIVMVFVVPPQTPAWIFFTACIFVAIVANIFLVRADVVHSAPRGKTWRTFPIVIVWTLFLLAILSRLLHWPIRF